VFDLNSRLSKERQVGGKMAIESVVTIVMYHYVRNLLKSHYPQIKGLQTSLFKEQLIFLSRYYVFVTMEACVEALAGGKPLPKNAALLTFDDGYIDHYTNVFPLLNKLGIQGSFFPPAQALLEDKVLDVNKIHYLLASKHSHLLYENLLDYVKKMQKEYNLKDAREYIETYELASRFDSKEVIFIKNMLQKGLPEAARKIILNNLFEMYVTDREDVFSKELYMNTDQLRCMLKNGMYIGGHGYEHVWLNTLNSNELSKELDGTLHFLEIIGAPTSSWVMCYPYGGYNDSVVRELKLKKCAAGLTSVVGLANLNSANAFTLPRLDTNDLPKDGKSSPLKWTMQVQ
jgi:peptidoglycan/xylan/chitin deacetylase (PgdA/CDA1 family)